MKTWRNTSGGHRPTRTTIAVTAGPDDQDRYRWSIDGYVMPPSTRAEIEAESRSQCDLGHDVGLIFHRQVRWPT